MRKLKLQVQMTVDGFISGAKGEMDWMIFDWSQDLKDYVIQITNPVDTILLGRNLAQGFIPHWTEALKKGEEGAKKMVETPKIVFSKTLAKSDLVTLRWGKTTIAGGELATEINALKRQPGNDMIVYGGGKFVSSLIKEKLIDELHFFVNPAVIGKGMPIFQEVSEKQNFKLLSAKQFECGISILTYNPVL